MFEMGFHDSLVKSSKLFQMTVLLAGMRDHLIIMWLQYKVFINDWQLLAFCQLLGVIPHPTTMSTTFQIEVTILPIVDHGHPDLSLVNYPPPLPTLVFRDFC